MARERQFVKHVYVPDHYEDELCQAAPEHRSRFCHWPYKVDEDLVEEVGRLPNKITAEDWFNLVERVAALEDKVNGR
jgi:hypothetical protein